MGRSEIVAVILAAGYSRRMERFKPLLDLGGQLVIARIIGSFIEAGIHDVRVVVGYRKELLTARLDELKASVIINDRYADGMFSSVQAGVSSIGPYVDAFFILPADIPLVSPSTIRLLAESYNLNEGKILIPCFERRNGHPPLIASKYKDCIADYASEGGLKGALRSFESATVRVPVADENILFDMDSPGDYDELQNRWKKQHVSSPGSYEMARRGALK
jgi:molybdenum cofactor cytidylyltransferase